MSPHDILSFDPSGWRTPAVAASLARDFATLAELVALNAAERPQAIAIVTPQPTTYAELVEAMDRAARGLQDRGLRPGDTVALCGQGSPGYVAAYLGVLCAGGVAAPLPCTAAPEDLARMVLDSRAGFLLTDDDAARRLAEVTAIRAVPKLALGQQVLAPWAAAPGARPHPVVLRPGDAFNIIYSSGTTGEPKGIVQSHSMRWGHVRRAAQLGYGADAVAMVATPPHSNLTLVNLLPTLALGGTAVLMPGFDVPGFLELAQRFRATHTFMVPVQYQRVLGHPDFQRFDLSAFRLKVCAGAPCAADLKAEIVARWPGELIDLYGMTEGGATCMHFAGRRPDKAHTVGQPQPGHEVRILREDGTEAAPGQSGEVVGHSAHMMSGYHNQPERTREVEWRDPAGRRFIRTGDIGVLDEEGFLSIVDRRKDMIISGGFNIYPSDLEAVLRAHPDVTDAAVVGVASPAWGETPVAFLILRPWARATAEAVRVWANSRLGKVQRISAVRTIEAFPRNAVDKILKTELRAMAADPGGEASKSDASASAVHS